MRGQISLALSLVVPGFLGCAEPRSVARSESDSCRPCHAALVDSYEQTAHRNTSALASPASIKGDLRAGANILRTGVPGVSYRIDSRPGGIYQVAMDQRTGYTHEEQVDVVVGSGRIGQTYLYWQKSMLFELPVSYLSAGRSWINSPGYIDGRIDFGRPVLPRCLECHSTTFPFELTGGRLIYGTEYSLGIQCSKCHGPGVEHIARQQAGSGRVNDQAIVNPATLPRERRLDVCGLCHSGIRPSLRPPFSFSPGQDLSAFLGPSQVPSDVPPDVHGDQIGLLRLTRCFQGSPELTCVTCHDVHRTEQNLEQMAAKCLSCHEPARHSRRAAMEDRLMSECIDCHMPKLRSQALQVRSATGTIPILYRSHAIAIYPPGDSSRRE